MPYDISWYEEKRILHVRFIGELSNEESMEIGNINTRHLEEGTAPVHIVVDLSQLDKFPTNIRQNSQFTKYLRNPKLGWVVITGGGTLVNFVASLISQVTGFKFAKRDSLESAVDFLQKQDDTLVAQA